MSGSNSRPASVIRPLSDINTSNTRAGLPINTHSRTGSYAEADSVMDEAIAPGFSREGAESPSSSMQGLAPRFAAAHFYQHGATKPPRQSSYWSMKSSKGEKGSANLSINYLPQKFTPVKRSGKNRWTKFKWTLFLSNMVLTAYALALLVLVLMTWLRAWDNANVVIIANTTPLILATVAAALCVFTCLLGWVGVILNSRPILVAYNIMLWVCFAMIASVGYTTYKRQAFNLPGKLSEAWSRSYNDNARLTLQNSLHCCGYDSPQHEATSSKKCFVRSTLPGCKSKFLKFERSLLHQAYVAAFAIVPFHILCIMSALLCSNHVNETFGKGLIPKQYRLSMPSMALIMDNYTNQLAGEYGNDAVYGKGGLRDTIAGSVRNSLSTSNVDLSRYERSAATNRQSRRGSRLVPSWVGTPKAESHNGDSAFSTDGSEQYFDADASTSVNAMSRRSSRQVLDKDF